MKTLVATLAPAADDADVSRFAALRAGRLFEGDLLTLSKRLKAVAHDVGEVNEEIVALVIARESEALGVVEETDDGFTTAR
jgi:hypothetical protein